jgi:hypothetical protein
MLSRLILLGLQLIAAWFAAPFIVRYIPGLGRMQLFVFAVVFAVVVWIVGLVLSQVLREAGMPTSSTLVSALIVALIGAALGTGLSHQAIRGADNSRLACMTKARESLPAPLLPSSDWRFSRSKFPATGTVPRSRLRTCRTRLQSEKRRI